MNKLIHLGLLALALTGAAQAATYTNASQGFNLRYPDSWTKRENIQGAVVAVVAPASGGFSRNVNVVVIPGAPAGTKLDDILSANRANLAKQIKGLKVLLQRSVSVGGVNGRELVYTGSVSTAGTRELRFKQRYTIQGSKLYVLTQTALANDTGADAALTPVLDSFSFKK